MSFPMIVIPTYNERENIEPLIRAIFRLYPEMRVTVVDDDSPDGTGQLVEDLRAEFPQLDAIHRPAKAGLGTAYIAGFRHALSAGAEYIFEMDADFSHHPADVGRLFAAAQEYDFVIGSRYVDGVRVEGWPFRRLLLSKFANIYAAALLVLPVWDLTAGFRCYRREALERINLADIHSDGYAFQIEMLVHTLRLGFHVAEVPILFRERARGLSKISRHVVWEAFWLVLRLRAPFLTILRHLRVVCNHYGDFVKQHPATQRNQPCVK